MTYQGVKVTKSSLMLQCARARDCTHHTAVLAMGLYMSTKMKHMHAWASMHTSVKREVHWKVETRCTKIWLTRGAGPRTTLPSLLYWLPWQGHLNFFSFCTRTWKVNHSGRVTNTPCANRAA